MAPEPPGGAGEGGGPGPPTPRDDWDLLTRGFRLLGIGTLAVVIMGACLGLGWFVDDELSTTPLFTLMGVVLGIVLGVLTTVAEIRRDL